MLASWLAYSKYYRYLLLKMVFCLLALTSMLFWKITACYFLLCLLFWQIDNQDIWKKLTFFGTTRISNQRLILNKNPNMVTSPIDSHMVLLPLYRIQHLKRFWTTAFWTRTAGVTELNNNKEKKFTGTVRAKLGRTRVMLLP